jgi:amino acid transporter|nr:MAG TPA: hypothetical protein [Caudoviricetes sp.]
METLLYSKIIFFLVENEWYNLISLLLAIVSIITGIFFYYKSKRIKQPTYAIKTSKLITEKIGCISNMDILYSGNKINNLSITKIALWNAGKDTINKEDIASSAPLTVQINPKYRILDCSIIYQKDERNNFDIEISKDKTNVLINFEYFDYEEGIVLQIFHTGNTSDDISIEGKIKSVKTITRKGTTNLYKKQSTKNIVKKRIFNIRKSRKIYSHILTITGLILIITFVWSFFMNNDTFEFVVGNKQTQQALILVTGFIYLFLGYNIHEHNVPKGFDIFNESSLENLEKKRKE